MRVRLCQVLNGGLWAICLVLLVACTLGAPQIVRLWTLAMTGVAMTWSVHCMLVSHRKRVVESFELVLLMNSQREPQP